MEHQPTQHANLNNWQPFNDFLKRNHQFGDGQIRWLLRQRETNGLAKCVKKIGKRLYIHEHLFAEWISNQ